MYQYVDGLVSGAFGYDVFDPGLVHVHGPAVLEDSSCCMKVLGAVQLIGPVKKEVARLVSHRWKKSKEKTCEVQAELQPVSLVEISTPETRLISDGKDSPRTSVDFFLSIIWISHAPSGI